MPLNPFEGRPGFRYIADPMGRLGFGRYVDERDLPDPFGRVMARPEPEPELMDLGDLFEIQAAVGMEGRNDRRDVAKVESLLGRLGVLDLGETDGVTGFFGARTDEAVRKFQKDQGLQVDGLITPEGPTLRALMDRLHGADGETTPGAGETPFVAREENPAPNSERPPLDPRRETVRRIAEQMLARRERDDDPLSFERPGQRLAEAEQQPANADSGGGDNPPPDQAPADPPAKAGAGKPGTSPNQTPEIPAYRKDDLANQQKAWEDFNREVGKLPGITPAEKEAFAYIFAAEGGIKDDPNSSASSGILRATLDRAKERGQVPGIENVENPSDLTVAQRAAVMRDYFDDTLGTVGGSKALDAIGDAQAAAALADTIYRHGRKGGTKIVQDAVNKVREDNGKEPIAKDGEMGPETLGAYRELAADAKTRRALMEELGNVRQDNSFDTEKPRIDFFRFNTDR